MRSEPLKKQDNEFGIEQFLTWALIIAVLFTATLIVWSL